jgi:hypothetical protein
LDGKGWHLWGVVWKFCNRTEGSGWLNKELVEFVFSVVSVTM